jgi:competence protein ComEA
MRHFSTAAAIVLISTLAAVAQTPPPPSGKPDPDHKALPAGPGRETMIRVCSKCHEPEVAADQQFDAAGWKDLVNQMASNGANATDAEFDEIAAYLTKSFPIK